MNNDYEKENLYNDNGEKMDKSDKKISSSSGKNYITDNKRFVNQSLRQFYQHRMINI